MPGKFFFLAGTVIICFIMGLIPEFAMIFSIIWGTLLITAAIVLKKSQLLILFFINLIILLIIAGGSNFIFYFTFFGMSAFVTAILTAYKSDYYELQKWGTIFAVLGVSLFLLISYLLTGDIGISEMQQSLQTAAQESINTYKEMGLFETYEQMGISQSEMEESIKQTIAAITMHLPAIYYIQAIITVFFMIFFASYLTLKRDIQRLKRKPFSQEVMPWQLVWIVILAIGLWVWGRDELNYVYYAGSNILVVITPIAMYYGTSVLAYKIKQLNRSQRNLWISGLIFMALVFLPSAIIFLSMLGLFDALINLRRLPAKQEE